MLRDTFHKDFTLNSGELQLQAIILRDKCRDLRGKKKKKKTLSILLLVKSNMFSRLYISWWTCFYMTKFPWIAFCFSVSASVKFEMFRYHPTHDCDDDGLTVLLSVGQDVHISCSMSADKPELHLEVNTTKSRCEHSKGLSSSGPAFTCYSASSFRDWIFGTSSSFAEASLSHVI